MKVIGILCGLSATVFVFAYLKSRASKCKDRVDLISTLPDPILHLILSRLPTTEEVVRTSILSSRWRHLWSSVSSIDVDYSRGPQAPQKFKQFVHSVLANHFDLDSFRLSCGNHFYMSTGGLWIDAAVGRNVKILDLKFGRHEDEDPVKKLFRTESPMEMLLNVLQLSSRNADEYNFIELPRCLATCGSLKALRLSLGGNGVNLLHLTCLSALRVLELNTCWLLNKNSVKDFFESCPLLEELSLVNCTTYFIPVFRISCPKLEKLRIDNGNIYDSGHWTCGYEDMCVTLEICCPKLVYLELVGCVAEEQFVFESLDSLKTAVIHPEDNGEVCELLSGISHVESLSLYLTKKNINLEDLPRSLPNLKTLELITTSDVLNMNVVIQILTSSPNIETLYLMIKEDVSYSSSPTEFDDVEFPIGHIFEQLQTVKMRGGMTGAVHEIGFIKFLLGSSPVLETFSIYPFMNLTDENLRALSDDVLKFPRASPKAGIIFLQD